MNPALREHTASLDAESDRTKYRYDVRGRLTLAKNPDVTRTFEYDALDRAVSMFDAQFGTARRTFDEDGRIRQAVYPDRDPFGFGTGAVVSYVYDARDLVVGIIDPTAGVWQLEYDALGRPVQRRDPTGITRKVAYDTEGFIASVAVAASNYSETSSYNDYDPLGNPLEIENAEGVARIAYDALSRIESVVYREGEPTEASEVFGYDRRGNRISHTDRFGSARTYDFDAADQLLVVRNAQTGVGQRSYTYDGAGRRIKEVVGGATTRYAYDALSRLTSIQSTESPVSLVYDAAGMRYRRTITFEQQTQDTFYFGEWIERKGGTSRRLIHLAGIDQVIGDVSQTGVVRSFLRDGTANVTHVATNGQMQESQGSGALAARRYEAFGATRGGLESSERGFASRISEGPPFGRLVNFRARHYDPATGVFLQPDPLGIDAKDLYAYGRNNPYAFIDPTGFDPTSLQSGVASLSGVVSNALFGSSGFGFNGPPTSPAPSGGGSPFQSAAGIVAGGSAGVLLGVNVLAPAAAACPVCAIGLGLAGLAYDASQDFAGAKSLFGAIDKAARGEATFSEAFNAAFPVGSIVGGFQSAATRGGSRALVNAGDEVLNQAAFTGAEVVNGFRVFGNKGLVGRTFNRNILLLEAEQIGARSPRGLLRAFEAEARAAGADELSIVGHGVINPKFLNPKLAERLGYQFEQINPDTVRIFKLLDQQ